MSYPGVIANALEPDPSPYHGDESPSVSDEKSYREKHGDVETATTEVESTTGVLHNERDIVTNVISVADDPSLNPWTVRAFIIGIGLSTFGGVLGV